MKIKLFLHGHLRDKIKKSYIDVEANSAYEALRRLDFLMSRKERPPLNIGRWKITVKGYETEGKLKGRLRHNILHIYPVFKTAKNVFKIIVGAVLVVAGAALTYLGIPGGPYLATTGVALILGEVAAWLFAPKLNTSSEVKNNSKYLGTIGNTVAAGTRIPFGYGLYKVSGHFISYNVSSTTIRVLSKE